MDTKATERIEVLEEEIKKLQAALAAAKRSVSGSTKGKSKNALNTPDLQSFGAYKFLLDFSRDVLWVTNLKRETIYISPSIEALTGYTPEECIAMPHEKRFTEETYSRIGELVKDAIDTFNKSGKIEMYYHFRLDYLKKGGGIRNAEFSGSLLADENGNLIGFQGITRDITDRVEFERVLLMNEARMSALYELSSKKFSDEQELVEHFIEAAVPLISSGFGYFHLVDEEEKSLTLYAWNKAAKQVCKVSQKYHFLIDDANIWTECFRTGEPVVHNDYQNASGKKGCTGNACITRHISVPLYDHGKIYAIAGAANKATDYTDEDVKQFSLFMHEALRIVLRKRAEKELQISRSRLELALSNGNIGIMEYFVPESTIATTKSVLDILGYGKHEIGTTFDWWLAQVHPDDRAELEVKLERLLAGAVQDVAAEFRARTKTGDYIWVLCNYRAVEWSKDGKPIRITGVMINLTEKIENEKKLQESEAKYRELVDTMSEGLAILDPRENFLFTNPATERIFGVKEGALIGKSLWDFLPSDQVSVVREMTNLRRNGERSTYELRILRKDGEERNLIVTAIPQMTAEGVFKSAFGTFRDITEKKRSKELISRKQRELQAVIDQIPQGIFYKDTKRRYVFCNAAFLEATGKKSEEIIGKRDEEIFGAERGERLRQEDEYLLLHENHRLSKEHDSIIYGKKNYYLTQKVAAALGGKVIGIAGFSVDLSEKRKDELERERLIAQLSESEKQLRESHAAKDKFFSIIAHDLRNPFHGFLGAAELLSADDSEVPLDRKRRLAGALHESAAASYKMIEQLLEWSRLQVGALQFRAELLELYPAASETMNLLHRDAETKGIRLENAVPRHLLFYFDRHMIATVLRNLISNAVKFTGQGGCVSVKASVIDAAEKTSPRDDPSSITQNILITVSDTGVGIPAQHIDKLFRIDQQYSSTGTNKEKGTGLGLVLCKEFIDAHRGKIEVASAVGKGTTVSIKLPVHQPS